MARFVAALHPVMAIVDVHQQVQRLRLADNRVAVGLKIAHHHTRPGLQVVGQGAKVTGKAAAIARHVLDLD